MSATPSRTHVNIPSLSISPNDERRCWTLASTPSGTRQAAIASRDSVADASYVLPDRALLIRKVWLDFILQGHKVLEIRGVRHHFAGSSIYLLETKTGCVRGRAILGAARELTEQEVLDNADAIDAMGYDHPMAWPLTHVEALPEVWHIPGRARQGCVTWVPRNRWEAFSDSGQSALAPLSPKRRRLRGEKSHPEPLPISDSLSPTTPPIVRRRPAADLALL